jgi:hypothetical protein
MSRRKSVSDPVRARLIEWIDVEIDASRECIQRAQDLAALLNALDTTGDKIEIDGNIVVGAFKKKEAAE